MHSYGTHQSTLLRTSRVTSGLSQTELGKALDGHTRAGQTISNIERGLCGIPPKHIVSICSFLKLPVQLLKQAMVKDYEESLDREVMRQLVKQEELLLNAPARSISGFASIPMEPSVVLDGEV